MRITSVSETSPPKPLRSLRFAPDVLPPVSETVSKASPTVESVVDSKTVALTPEKSVAETVLASEKPLPSKKLAAASDSPQSEPTTATKEVAAKPVDGAKENEKNKESGVVMIPHPASGSTPPPPKISDAAMDDWKNALANSVEGSAGKTVDVKSIAPSAKPIAPNMLKPAKTIADLVASEKIDLKPLNERVSPATTVMRPGIPTVAPTPEPESETVPPLSTPPTPPPPMDPKFLAMPSETSDKESVVNEKPQHDLANTEIPTSVSKPETTAATVLTTAPKSDPVSEPKEILRGQSPMYNPLDDSLGSRPPNPQGVIADSSAIQEKLVETPKSADPAMIDPLADITDPLAPGTVAKPTPVLSKSQQWTNSALLITTLGALGALMYALATALDYRNRWMQSLTSQNNRLSFAFDGAAEGIAPTEDTDLYVDPYTTNPYAGFPRFVDPLDASRPYLG